MPSWTWQNPLPNGNPLFAVSCPTVNVCFAAGADGPILATSDGGSSWVQQAQAVGINGVSCASTSDCVVVGDNGYVARTSNSGANWTPTTTNSGNFLAAVTCPTTTVCYAVGYAGSIDRSADGGATWSPQTSGTTNNLFGVSCTSATTCSAVGAGSTLASTTDGGATWIETQMDPYGYSYYAISCWSASGCTAVGQHGIEYTTSIGESNIGSSSDVFAVSCLALYNCFAAAADGLVYIQEQNQQCIYSCMLNPPWSAASVGETLGLYGVACPTGATCVTVGDFGLIAKSASAGTGWSQLSPQLLKSWFGPISCPTTATCVSVSRSPTASFKTTDGGVTWLQQGATTLEGQGESVSCPDTNTCFAVGMAGTISKTVNGAALWSALSSGVSTDLLAIDCISASACVAVGAGGVVLVTTDGTNWSSKTSGTTENLHGVSCPSSTVCFAVGGFNPSIAILKSVDGGVTWNPQSGPFVWDLISISCPSTAVCFAISDTAGDLIATSDGGSHWIGQSVGTTDPIYAVRCPTASSCFVLGHKVFETGDGGAHWLPQDEGLPFAAALWYLDCPSPSICVGTSVSGSHPPGYIAGTTNGGATPWHQLAPLDLQGTATAISCTSTSHCIVVTSEGGIWATNDGGMTWAIVPQTASAGYSLGAISCPSALDCFASGWISACCTTGGEIIATVDGGATWTAQLTEAKDRMVGVSCASSAVCVAVSQTGTFTKTNDGVHWNAPGALTGASILSAISCPSTTVCFATDYSGNGRIFVSRDGAASWTLSFDLANDPQAGPGGHFGAVDCPTTTACYAVGDSQLIATTTDGGSNWRTDNVPVAGGFFTNVACVSASTCEITAAMNNGPATLLRTTDYGGTWLAQYGGSGSAIGVAYSALSCPASNVCIAVGAYGVAARTTNGGNAWATERPAGTLNPIHGISCPNASTCYATAFDTLMSSHDGGAHWSQNTLPTTDALFDISCPDATTCFAVGWPGAIYYTGDGGVTWISQTSPITGADRTLDSISCWSVTGCIAVGGRGTVLETQDGTTWHLENPGTSQFLLSVDCPGTASCVVVGGNGTALTLQGSVWRTHKTNTTAFLAGLSCTPIGACYAVGKSGTVLQSLDSGVTWSSVNSGDSNDLDAVSCLPAGVCVTVGTFGTVLVSFDGVDWIPFAAPTLTGLFAVAVSDLSHVEVAGSGANILGTSSVANIIGSLTPDCGSGSATSNPAARIASTTSQYSLTSSDGARWQEMDATKLRVYCSPSSSHAVLLTGNSDLFTASAGFNQDIGIFVSDNGGPDQLVAWKESGGFAGTFSPNAAHVQALVQISAGHFYIFKLKWKTNRPAMGATIFAGAGSGPPYSPTSLLAKVFPTSVAPQEAVSSSQYHLAGSDGQTWRTIDLTNLAVTTSPGSDATAVLGANADLFTATAGYNQDLGVFVSDNGGPDNLVAWKESGGFAGTFSPNAAFVLATYPMSGGHTYVFSLKWKTNKSASGVTIFAGAGGGPPYSPTSLSVESVPTGVNPYSVASINQYALRGSDGVAWHVVDPSLQVTVTPTSDTNAVIGANIDLFTGSAGYNQDFGIVVSEDGGPSDLLAWKESGGFAGTFSPNAAFAQTEFHMTSGHTYVFTLVWKTNRSAPTSTIYAGAGGAAPFSPSRLIVDLAV